MNFQTFKSIYQSRDYDDDLRRNLKEQYPEYYYYYSRGIFNEIKKLKKERPSNEHTGPAR